MPRGQDGVTAKAGRVVVILLMALGGGALGACATGKPLEVKKVDAVAQPPSHGAGSRETTREEGRPGPFAIKRGPIEPEKKLPEDRILHVSSFRDPVREIDKLTELYESLAEARREVGEDAPPFHKFAELVKNQVKKLRDTGSPEVAFRVAVKDGKVNFTARGLKGVSE